MWWISTNILHRGRNGRSKQSVLLFKYTNRFYGYKWPSTSCKIWRIEISGEPGVWSRSERLSETARGPNISKARNYIAIIFFRNCSVYKDKHNVYKNVKFVFLACTGGRRRLKYNGPRRRGTLNPPPFECIIIRSNVFHTNLAWL